MLDKFEEDRFPEPFSTVCSVERLRVWGGLERLAQLSPRFDLIVVDEAHVVPQQRTPGATRSARCCPTGPTPSSSCRRHH